MTCLQGETDRHIVSLQPRRKERYDVLKEPRIKLNQSASSVSLTGLEQRAVLSTEADCEFYSRREVLKRLSHDGEQLQSEIH